MFAQYSYVTVLNNDLWVRVQIISPHAMIALIFKSFSLSLSLSLSLCLCLCLCLFLSTYRHEQRRFAPLCLFLRILSIIMLIL